jgi:methyl-accepting chemotaxis protein
MDELKKSSSEIAKIIKVIDDIAFQTNILSLNAAVEAATAGEAGKGFAVVAAEVRNLASRSAEAAKEIKDLVEDANTKANEGKNISDEMIKGYEVLNDHITETIHIIEDVSSASKEQMTGIEQINDAVTELDKATQENASVASDASDIAKETNSMAQSIVDNANEKEFEGKEEFNLNDSTQRTPAVSKQYPPKAERSIPAKERTVRTKVKKEAVSITSKVDDKEWESF